MNLEILARMLLFPYSKPRYYLGNEKYIKYYSWNKKSKIYEDSTHFIIQELDKHTVNKLTISEEDYEKYHKPSKV